MFGINGGELVIILVLAVLVIGPERLPGYAEQLATVVRRAKVFLVDAKEKVSEELGPEVADVDWAQLDPRRYDPRRIVRDALLEDTVLDPRTQDQRPRPTKTGGPANRPGRVPQGSAAAPEPAPERLPVGVPAPFDAEAT
ncbi:Sec-independent protein translocase TatB [Sanguibacter suaedae]|uniref:Sec-independent protein translocase TatB n=1 Tax=Sanguibacter suaedae TaxID=2795737 RepID=A0A934I4P8_9MICO|nr:Sec-independent protein translocase TatB [Sanguibacter suaedae]MBI9115173.1 Sec-independent protein translocase TatB [Sanguibacter suaedae]